MTKCNAALPLSAAVRSGLRQSLSICVVIGIMMGLGASTVSSNHLFSGGIRCNSVRII